MRTLRVLAPVLAGAGLGAALLLAPAARASTTPPAVYSVNQAGVQASGNGWNFRYLQADVTLPDITTGTFKNAIPGGYGASLRFRNAGQFADLGISTTPASGFYNAGFAVEYPDGTYGCTNGASPAIPPGDTVRMAIGYSYSSVTAGRISYSVTDLTRTGHDFSGTCQDGSQFFGAARVVAGFSVNDWDAPSPAVHQVNGNQRLVQLRNTVVTSRTGIRSSIGTGSGNWPVQRIAMTDDGHPTGVLLASVPYTWGTFAFSPDNVVRDGRNFSVWMPASPG